MTVADITTSGSEDSFLKCTHITRTRLAHQLTAHMLATLQQLTYGQTGTTDDFEEWKVRMWLYTKFLFWDIIRETKWSLSELV